MSLDIYLQVRVDTGAPTPFVATIYEDNITGNVCPMWTKAGVYDALYESEGTPASQWLDVLRKGVQHMADNASEYLPLNPSNGWGSFDGALRWLRAWLAACEMHPKAIIHVRR